MTIATIDPSTGASVQRFDELDPAQLEAKLARAAQAFKRQRKTSFASRAACLLRAAERLERDKRAYGELMTREMGKTLASAIAEAEKCALACRYYAEHGESLLRDEAVAGGAGQSYLRYLPLGPVLAIMPWNFPFWQVVRFAAPALMAGNVGLLKHASNVPQCALALEQLFLDAGFEPGVFQSLLIGAKRTAALIDDPRVAAITLTGSEAAGVSVAQQAGRSLKKTVLELGGSDPFIVMPSADLEQAARTAVAARVINNGQSCIAAKRFIVHERVYPEFERRMLEHMRALRVGDPMLPDTDVGPLATATGRDDVAEQVARSVQAGASLLLGGHALDRPGFFYAPTLLANIPPAAPAYRDEVFGPVALLFRARDIDHAIELANDSAFGLGSSVWTNDAAEQRRFIDELEAGLTFVNAMVASDPRMPFGGVKRSGYGRELGAAGIREFVNLKSVVIHTAAAREHARSE